MDLSKIPNRLRGKPYFCLMKLEQKPGKDKKDKVPYRTNGARADPTDPNHFTSLENVMKVFDKGGYDGIGIGLFDDIIAIDIDDCVEDGKLNDFATEIVEALKTYAEFSISGTGVHIWARAPGLIYDKERYYFNNRTYGLEIYPAGVTTKFIVTTGNAINDCDINECTEAFIGIAAIVFTRYMLLATEQRQNEDQRTLGELFFFLVDEMADITFSRSLGILMDALMASLQEILKLSDEQLSALIADFESRLPEYLRNALHPGTAMA